MALYHFTLKSDRKPDGTKIMANEHAEYNGREGKYEELDKQRASIASAAHLDYINRDSSFTVKEGCIYKAHRLPAWANNSPKRFFAAADAYEESEHAYKEIEFALQNELTPEQNLEIVSDFIGKNFSDYYYAYAVHDKAAALGEGERNPHCHFMFSPRQMDELEKEQERKPECFFKKARRVYTKKDGTIIDNRRDGGCKIPPVWNKAGPGIEHLKYLRKDFEETTNQVLEKYGHTVSIDCRSHQTRHLEAVKEGNRLEAEMFSLPPEKHLGPAAVNNHNDPRVMALHDLRELRRQTQRMIEAADRLEKLAADHSFKKKQKQLSAATREIEENAGDISPELTLLKEKMRADAEQIAALQSEVVLYRQAVEEAQESYLAGLKKRAEIRLPELEKEIAVMKENLTGDISKETLHALMAKLAIKRVEREKLLREKDMLTTFQRHKAGDADHEKMRAIRQIFAEKTAKSTLTRMANNVMLRNLPNRQKIEVLRERQTVTAARIRSVMAAKVKTMTDDLSGQTTAGRRYTAKEIRKSIYDILAVIRAEKRTLEKKLAPLEARYISETRAKKMAIDLYTRGKTKELRELQRAIEKQSELIQKSEDTLLAKEYAFLYTPKPKWLGKILGSTAVKRYETAKDEIRVLKAAVAVDKAELHALQDKAGKTELEINALLKAPQAAVKIEKISQGILKKNQPVAQEIFALRAQKDGLIRQEREFVTLADAASRQIAADGDKNISYTPKDTGKSVIDVITLIARAFSGNYTACAAVARIKDDSSILDWEAKDAAERKVQQREAAWARGEF